MSRYTRLTRSVTELRAFSADRSPAVSPSAVPTSAAGELVLTPGQKQALLKLRGSDVAKAVLDELRKRGEFVATTRDNYALEHAGLAINKGSLHVIAKTARWKADQIANHYARELKLHVLTYDYGSTGINARAAFVRCSCGDFTRYFSRAVPSYLTSLGCAGAEHQLRESVKQIDGAKL